MNYYKTEHPIKKPKPYILYTLSIYLIAIPIAGNNSRVDLHFEVLKYGVIKLAKAIFEYLPSNLFAACRVVYIFYKV